MKQVLLNIPENRYEFFMELVEQLGLESTELEIIPEWQKQIVLERIKTTKPEEYLSWEEIERELKLEE